MNRSPARSPGGRLRHMILATAGLATLGAAGSLAVRAAGETALPAASPVTQPTTIPTTLPTEPVTLANSFDSLSGGISVRPPLGCKPAREIGKEQIIEFDDEARKWSLSIGRQSFPQPMALLSHHNAKDEVVPGIVPDTVNAILAQYPGAQVLRQDTTNLGNSDVGMIAIRYTKNGERRLAQHAIIEANDQLFYLLAFTTPGRKVDPKNEDDEDPGERLAVETFRAVCDSVRLLDRTAIKKDQDERLIRTRSLFYNCNEKKLTSILIPEQYIRIQRELPGEKYQDIGYSYIVEEPDRKGGQDGIKVGIRTRVSKEPGKLFPREDSVSWMFVSMDRRHEDWSKNVGTDPDGKPKGDSSQWKLVTEFGSSDLKTSRFVLSEEFKKQHRYELNEVDDPKQPAVGVKDFYTLNVQYSLSQGELEPVARPLPPFYLPQALGVMLPRLLPANEPKTYMMASFVSDVREVMLRYIDVGREQQVKLGGRIFRAVPITDRFGLEGAITTHYVSNRGEWLGSYNKEAKTVILPTDAATLETLWRDVNLARPEDIAPQPTPRKEARPTAPQRSDRPAALPDPVPVRSSAAAGATR